VIRKVVIRRFKKFDDVEFVLPGHVVLAGPNNTGKTTLLQAIAAWDFALNRWRGLNDFRKHGGAFTKAPVARQSFAAVPLRAFDLLWRERRYKADEPIEIEIQSDRGWTLPMELIADSTEQIYVRPRKDVSAEWARTAAAPAVFIPAMSGLLTEEPLYAKREFIDLRLAQGRPGEILRNVLVEANQTESVWSALTHSIRELFGYELVRPDPRGAYILADYEVVRGGPQFDIASAGSGFQQVLMLLAHLHTRPGSVLLLDEPDAHLHVILQGAIYGELRAVAAQKGSQLIVATHSEVVIDTVDPDELCVVLGRPRMLADTVEKKRLIRSLGRLTNTDVMLAESAAGILYCEDKTDLQILRSWAKVLDHPARRLLTTRIIRHPTGGQNTASDHFSALRLVSETLPGLEIVDRDGNPNLPETEMTGTGLQRVRWKRYEIESYLVHPVALDRFVEAQVGAGEASTAAKKGLRARLEEMLAGAAPAFLADPLNPPALVESFLKSTKARTEILPPLLSAAGLPEFPYTRYSEIAALMTPDEIHPEVKEKLDAIVKAFGK